MLRGYEAVKHLTTAGRVETHLYRGGDGAATRVVHRLQVRALAPETLRTALAPLRPLVGLAHPNLVSVRAVGEMNGLPCIATDHVQATTLQQGMLALGPGGRLSTDDAARIFVDVCRALDHLHRLQRVPGAPAFVHGAVVPAHILVTPQGSRLTHTGVFQALRLVDPEGHGEPWPYPAPELLMGARLGLALDVFCVGACLYECTTGRPLLDRYAPNGARRLHGRYVAPSELVRGYPRDFEALVERALASHPGDRHHSFVELGRALAGFIRDESVVFEDAAPPTLGPWGVAEVEVGPAEDDPNRPRTESFEVPARWLNWRPPESADPPPVVSRSPPALSPEIATTQLMPLGALRLEPTRGRAARADEAPPPPQRAAQPADTEPLPPLEQPPRRPVEPDRLPALVAPMVSGPVMAPPTAQWAPSTSQPHGPGGGRPAAPADAAPANDRHRMAAWLGISLGVTMAAFAITVVVFLLVHRGDRNDRDRPVAAAPGTLDRAGVDTLLNRAEMFVEDGRHSAALDLLSALRASDLPDATARIRLAELRDSASVGQYLSEARQAMELGRLDEAEAAIRRALLRRPQDADARRLRETLQAERRKVAQSVPADPAAAPPSGERALVRLASDPPGLITVDGRVAGYSPVGELPLTHGEHRVEIRLRGYETLRQAIQVGPETRTFDFRLVPESGRGATAPPEEDRDPRKRAHTGG